MQKSILKHSASVLVLAASLGLNACAVAPVAGYLYSSVRFPGEFNPAHDVAPKKEARGCQHWVLGLIAVGNSGAGQTAVRNGIERIAYVDHSSTIVLWPIYQNHCTIVVGE